MVQQNSNELSELKYHLGNIGTSTTNKYLIIFYLISQNEKNLISHN